MVYHMEILPHRTTTARFAVPSHRHQLDAPFACERPESPEVGLVAGDDCPGCRVWLAHVALECPSELFDRERHGERGQVTAIEAIREALADDPMLVVVERELARRG